MPMRSCEAGEPSSPYFIRAIDRNRAEHGALESTQVQGSMGQELPKLQGRVLHRGRGGA